VAIGEVLAGHFDVCAGRGPQLVGMAGDRVGGGLGVFSISSAW